MKQLLFLISFIVVGNLFAQNNQRKCSSDEKLQELFLSHPELVEINKNQNKRLAQANNINKAGIITIPVVIHIIYKNSSQNISNAQVFSQINALNKDFRRLNTDANLTPNVFSAVDAEIEFCLATVDPNGNPTNGITRRPTTVSAIGNTNNYYKTSNGGSDIWNRDQYMNIWVCEIGNGDLGFTYPPGIAPADQDGIVIDYENFGTTPYSSFPYNKGRTTTHEVGHWLGLLHLWGSGGGGCSSDDLVNDTPNQFGPNYGCPAHPSTSCTNSGDMFMNYMDYTDDNCMNAFTLGQKSRIINAINQLRAPILNSVACGGVGLEENNLSHYFKIFPTYCENEINIEYSKSDKYSYEIINLEGKKVVVRQNIHQTTVVDVSTLNNGIYFLKILSNRQQLIQKFVKVNALK